MDDNNRWWIDYHCTIWRPEISFETVFGRSLVFIFILSLPPSLSHLLYTCVALLANRFTINSPKDILMFWVWQICIYIHLCACMLCTGVVSRVRERFIHRLDTPIFQIGGINLRGNFSRLDEIYVKCIPRIYMYNVQHHGFWPATVLRGRDRVFYKIVYYFTAFRMYRIIATEHKYIHIHIPVHTWRHVCQSDANIFNLFKSLWSSKIPKYSYIKTRTHSHTERNAT